MDMKELRKNAEKVIAERFPDFNFSTLDWGELDPFYLEHPEEIPIEHEFIGYRQDGDVAEDYQGNLYLVLCDPGIHPIGSVQLATPFLRHPMKRPPPLPDSWSKKQRYNHSPYQYPIF